MMIALLGPFAVAVALATIVERMSEYVVLPVLDAILSLVKYKLEGHYRLVIVSAINGALYGILFGYDFISSVIFEALGVQIAEWQGLVICFLLIAGGSNLIHDIFQAIDKPAR